MKKLYILFLVSISILFTRCNESDDIQFVENGTTNPVIISPSESIILNEDIVDNKVFTLVWNDAVIDTPTTVTYTVEMAAAGTEFNNPIILGVTNQHFLSMTAQEFNEAALSAGLNADEEGAIEIRVISTVGTNNGVPLISEAVTFYTTPFSNSIPQLFMVGAFQAYYEKAAWTPTEALEMKYIGDGTTLVFEAFTKLATDDGFKFISAAADWETLSGNFGTIGGIQDGTLENSGTSSDIKASSDGLYYVQVDIDNLTYQLVPMNWGIIGDSTSFGWDDETPMTYDFTENQFSTIEDLVDGQLKLRSKNTGNAIYGAGEDWKFNVGNSGEEAVASDTGDGNFEITAGNHTITLQLGFDGAATVVITKN